MVNPTRDAPGVNGHADTQRKKRTADPPAPGILLTAALEYQSLGWSVVPLCHPRHEGHHYPKHATACTRPGKQPVRKLTPLRVTPFTADDLTKEWRKNPGYNVGVLTGRISQLVMVDVDSDAALVAWEDFLGDEKVATWEFASGKGWPHYVYRWSADWAPRGEPLRHVSEKLDLIGEDDLSVMPPSVHANGSPYQWTRGGPGSRMPIADAPESLVGLLRGEGTQNRPRGGRVQAAPPMPDHEVRGLIRRANAYVQACEPAVSGQGGRLKTFKILCALIHGFGLSDSDAVQALLWSGWNARCQPPWTDEELFAEAAGARERGSYERIEEKPLPKQPAPPSAMPVITASHVNAMATIHAVNAQAQAANNLPGRRASALKRKTLSFLYEPYVAMGNLTLLVGAPSAGKSTFLAYLMSRAKRSLLLPGYEEDVDLMWGPRLEASGVDMEGVQIIDTGDWKMPHARERLTRVALEHGSELIVLDPIGSYLPEGGSENDTAAVRPTLESFQRIASDTGAAVVGVRHPGKDPNNLMRGSGAWREVPRVVLELMRDPGPPLRRLLRFEKPGLGYEAPPREYALVGPDKAPKRFVLGESVTQEDADFLRAVSDHMERYKVDQAEELLRRLLTGDRMESKAVFAAGELERLTEKPMRVAARRLGVEIDREGQGADHRSYWSLPPAGGGKGG